MESLKIIFATTVVYSVFVIIFLEIIMLFTAPEYNLHTRCNSKSLAMYMTIFGALFASNSFIKLANIDMPAMY